jgi:hypothetical protein
LSKPLRTARGGSAEIAGDGGPEERILQPSRILRRQGADAVENEQELGVGRLLHPERAIIVEDGGALRSAHEIRSALGRDGGDEVEQRALRQTIATGGKRIGAGLCKGGRG